MATKIEEARKAIALLKTEAGGLPFFTKNVEDIVAPGGMEAMDGTHFDLMDFQQRLEGAVEVMQIAAKVLESLIESEA